MLIREDVIRKVVLDNIKNVVLIYIVVYGEGLYDGI